MKELSSYAEILLKSIVCEPDLLKVSTFELDDKIKLDIMVSKEDMGRIIGKNGKTIQAIRTLIAVYAYQYKLPRVDVNVESI